MKELLIKATIKVDEKTGKKKIVGLHFPDGILIN